MLSHHLCFVHAHLSVNRTRYIQQRGMDQCLHYHYHGRKMHMPEAFDHVAGLNKPMM